MTHRRFVLVRDEDVTGVSGTGTVAEGVHWPHGDVVALRWTSEWPTSVVFHDRGIASVEAIHGHNGKTRIVWLDEESAEVARITRERDAALETARGLLAAATFLDGSMFRCGICGRQEDDHDADFICAGAESTITAIETGAIHDQR